jgi:hypothetical protein
MRPIDNTTVTPDNIDWSSVSLADCGGCACWNCMDENDEPFNCRDGTCDIVDNMCNTCPVRVLFQ